MILDLPPELRPTGILPVSLPSGRTVELPRCTPRFRQWSGLAPAFSFGKKAFLDYHGTPVFAEIYILRLLLDAGWDGVWAETYGGLVFLREMPAHSYLRDFECAIPSDKKKFFWSISAEANGHSGCFDVFAWRGSTTLFCESKRQKKDRLQPTQLRWIDAALANAVLPEQLLIAEWDMR